MIHDSKAVSSDYLALIRGNLFSLLDEFKSLEGNHAIIYTFFEKLKINNQENQLLIFIIESALSDLKADLDDYKEAIGNIYNLVKELD
ncbi:hypothetical protein [Geminocystis sp. NIES-3709]|uniref:hypothetical protein n=1 Tax=Geminocystis sp. NIES-3709 TaxID=1617448 RepID=UPI0005FC3E00|nr:hypothetical protein [Geminocystis sp. NIES-3709]BAQ67169.1 hypothetical protein GM3709_3934 [Geminocystis sp. NIES-3709]